MADPVRGLRVSLKFGDILDANETLENLNLPISDLDKIRGIGESVSQEDLITISGNDLDIEKNAIGIFSETMSYENVLKNLNDSRRRIGQNLNVNGRFIAPSFKFKTVDFDNANQIKTVDFSTSRASAWSAFGDSSLSIFYGGDVKVTNGNSIELSSLEYTGDIIEKEFDSQVPTHKIRIDIDGSKYDLYAMKGIPLTFTGAISSVPEMSISYNVLAGDIKPSWVIQNIDNDLRYVYRDISIGSGSNRKSTINFSDIRILNREIQVYYPVDNITEIKLNNTRLVEFPKVVMNNLATFECIKNQFIEIPDFATYTPSLTTLNLSDSDMRYSNNQDLNTFTQEVVKRLPSTLVNLTLNNVYSDTAVVDFGDPVDGLPNLKNFRATATTSNSRRMSGTSPDINSGLLTYYISSNRFNDIANTVLQSSSLERIDISNNDRQFASTIDFPNASNLKYFKTGLGNAHNIVDMSGKTLLETYYADSMTFVNGSVGTNVINNCPSLTYFRVNNTNISGALPSFETNTSLERVISWSTRWEDADASYSISNTTFGSTGESGCRPTLYYFNVTSGYLSGPIHEDALLNMTNLAVFRISSGGNGITGSLPKTNSCPRLGYYYLDRNKLSGTISSLNSNQNLRLVNFSYNQFEGLFPTTNLPLLGQLIVNNNNLTGFNPLNMPSLYTLNATNNSITTLPDFENLRNLKYIYFGNNNISSYNKGSITNLKRMQLLDLSDNNLTTGDIDNILLDLNDNYDINSNRTNVNINLSGNAPSSGTEETSAIVAKLTAAGWSIGLA